jgi:hypothetical protein
MSSINNLPETFSSWFELTNLPLLLLFTMGILFSLQLGYSNESFAILYESSNQLPWVPFVDDPRISKKNNEDSNTT